MPSSLSTEQLCKRATDQEVKCESTVELEPITTIIGQDRAVKALKFGLDVSGQGFNIFISGYDGTGKASAAHRFINDIAKELKTPDDWLYVNNFTDPSRPRAISLQPGKGSEFREDIKQLMVKVKDKISELFESEAFAKRKEEVIQKFQEEKDALFNEVNDYARKNGFMISQSPMGFETIPLNDDGQPMKGEEYNTLSPEVKKEMEQKGREVQNKFNSTLRKIQKIDQQINAAIEQLKKDVVSYNTEPMIDVLREKYPENERINTYLDEVTDAIINNVSQFLQKEASQNNRDPYAAIQTRQFMKKFEVNVLVDNKKTEGAPVISEHHPTYTALFGAIEKESTFGTLETDFTLIRQGSIHDANGGFIIIPVDDLLRNPFSWESVINALNNEEVTIEDATEKLGFISTRSLRPEPVPLNIKVILLGTPMQYNILYNWIDDFRKLFKVKSEFDSVMDRSDKNIQNYLGFISMLCREQESLVNLDCPALKKVLEYGARLAGHQDKLSTQFRQIFDLISETNHYALKNGKNMITAEDVEEANEEKTYRSNLIQEKVQEMISEGTLLIDVASEKTGEINGLAVLSLGDFSFGKPNKITASLGMGKGQVLDIEREAKTGGPIHTKGVLILSGYLMDKYASNQPMHLTTRLVFEQSYSGVEGDSASTAEACAIMSEIGQVPIKQSIAVTGSMNQKGYVQAIGGVNEKIEGFYEVCRNRGLDGSHGVIIPESNVRNLMLKDEVVKACDEGKFSVWAVSTVDEAFSLLSGMGGGAPGASGEYPENTFNRIIHDKIEEYSKRFQEFNNGNQY